MPEEERKKGAASGRGEEREEEEGGTVSIAACKFLACQLQVGAGASAPPQKSVSPSREREAIGPHPRASACQFEASAHPQEVAAAMFEPPTAPQSVCLKGWLASGGDGPGRVLGERREPPDRKRREEFPMGDRLPGRKMRASPPKVKR